MLLHLLVPVLQTDDQTLFKMVKSAFSYSRAYVLLCSLLSILRFCQHTDKVIQIVEAITLSLYVGTAFKIWYAKSNETLKHNFMTRRTFFFYVFFWHDPVCVCYVIFHVLPARRLLCHFSSFTSYSLFLFLTPSPAAELSTRTNLPCTSQQNTKSLVSPLSLMLTIYSAVIDHVSSGKEEY